MTVDLQAFVENRMQELLASWNTETPNSRTFVDIMMHSNYNFKEKHQDVLAFINTTFHVSPVQELLWRTNRMVPEKSIMNQIVEFIRTQHQKN